MGQFLDKPNTDKESHHGDFHNCAYGLSSMQGWRIHMEDAHTHVTNIPALPDTSFFAVFDGHGGKTVSVSSAPKILPAILQTSVLKEMLEKNEVNAELLGKAYKAGLLQLDDLVKESHEELKLGQDRSGSTVVACFITPTHYVFGNTGDSRVVLASVSGDVVFASEDHKPMSDSERARIKDAGGFVELGRVCGNLAVSRALGDYEYKDRSDLPPEQQKITADPDVTILSREDSHGFLILACDGIWDVMTNEQAIAYVKFYYQRSYTCVEIAEKMLDHCLAQGSKDNMSVIVISLPNAPKPTISLPGGASEEERKKREDEWKSEIEEKLLSMKAANITVVPHDDIDDDD